MTIEDLRETAALAHLNLNDSELAAALPAFEQMLGYFAVMDTVDEDCAAFPDNSPAVSSGFFCADTAGSSSHNENMLGNAGEHDGQFIVIPHVLER